MLERIAYLDIHTSVITMVVNDFIDVNNNGAFVENRCYFHHKDGIF